MGYLRSLGRDWIAAPISGTLLILAMIGAGIAAVQGNIVVLLLFLIYGNQVEARRKTYLEER